MKIYSSCFVGIALPQTYQKKFENLLADIKAIESNIEVVYPKTPHITLYYLNKQSQYSLDEISTLIKPKLHILKNSLLRVGGFGYFTQDNPKVLFLNVSYPTAITDFNKTLSEIVNSYGDVDNNYSFHPHVTIGRILSNSAKESFIKKKEELRSRIKKIKWEFTCDEITIYGVDSSQSPQYQKILTVLSMIK